MATQYGSILIGTPAEIPLPPSADYFILFLNTSASGLLYAKYFSGESLPYTYPAAPGCFSSSTPGDITAEFWEKIMCAFESGMMDATQLQAMLTAGFSVYALTLLDNRGWYIVSGNSVVVSTAITTLGLNSTLVTPPAP